MFQIERVNYSPWNIEALMQLVLAFDILIASDWQYIVYEQYFLVFSVRWLQK